MTTMEQTAQKTTGPVQRWWQHVRRFVAPPAVGAGALPAASLVTLSSGSTAPRGAWLRFGPPALVSWRLALAQRWSTLDGKTVVLLLLLADVLWGALWRMAGGRAALLAFPTCGRGQALWLPYLQANSPAARLFGEDEPDVWAYALRGGRPSAAAGAAGQRCAWAGCRCC